MGERRKFIWFKGSEAKEGTRRMIPGGRRGKLIGKSFVYYVSYMYRHFVM